MKFFPGKTKRQKSPFVSLLSKKPVELVSLLCPKRGKKIPPTLKNVGLGKPQHPKKLFFSWKKKEGSGKQRLRSLFGTLLLDRGRSLSISVGPSSFGRCHNPSPSIEGGSPSSSFYPPPFLFFGWLGEEGKWHSPLTLERSFAENVANDSRKDARMIVYATKLLQNRRILRLRTRSL